MTNNLKPVQKALRDTNSAEELREALQIISQEREARGQASLDPLVELMPDLVQKLKKIGTTKKLN